MNEPGDLHGKHCKFLLRYQVTPLSSGQIPPELFLGRNVRTKLDFMRPTESAKKKNKSSFEKHFQVGDRVQSRNYSRDGLWKDGIIKRHYNQLRSCNVEKKMNINTETGFGTTLDLEVDCKNSPNTNILIQSTENTLNQELIQEKEIWSTEEHIVLAGVESLPVIVQKDNQLEQQFMGPETSVQLAIRRSTRIKKLVQRLIL